MLACLLWFAVRLLAPHCHYSHTTTPFRGGVVRRPVAHPNVLVLRFQLIIHSITNHVKSELNVFSFSTSTCTSSPVQSSYLKLYLVSILMHYDIYTCINLAFRFSLQWALCIFNFHLEYNCHHRVLSIEAPMFRYVISSGMNSTHGFSFNGADDASNFTLLSLPLLALSCSFHSRMLRL